MNKLTCSLIAVLVLSPLSAGDALKKSRVPAGARWVAHLDVEALKASKIYEVVRTESMNDGSNGLDEGLAHFKMFAGIDPTTDFKSVTVYCTAKSEKSCVALLSGNAKIDTALEKLKTMENYRTTPAGSYALHTWGGEHDTWYGYVYRKDGSDERVMVASQDSGELLQGLAVLEGNGENMSGSSRAPFRATPGAGSILFAAAGDGFGRLGDIEPMSAVAKLAKSIVLDVGEDRGQLFAHVALDTRKPEDAQRVQQVLQGAVALVALVGDEDHSEARAKLQHLVEGLRLSVSDTRVDADFRYDAKSLLEDLKSLEQLDEHKSNADKSEKKHRSKKHQEKKSEDD